MTSDAPGAPGSFGTLGTPGTPGTLDILDILDRDWAADRVSRFAGQPVMVVGDVMLDRFIVGRVTRISPEAPVPIVRFQSEYARLGGAANVAHNIAALGGRATLVGVVGEDEAGGRIAHLLEAAGVEADGLIQTAGWPTTEKVRVVTERNQQVVRIDYERDVDLAQATEQEIVDRLAFLGAGMRALLVSDYLKGAITRAVVEALATLKAAGAPLIVDPKIPHLGFYSGATLITPNHHEAEAATHMRIRNADEAAAAAREFRRRAGCDAVLITRGEHGMWLSADQAELSVPATAREVSDVTGAGDTVVATLALALASGATLTQAAVLANHAAGIVVGKFGPSTVTTAELVESFG
jgi:D-glycero-beta-D-manno-heptose-7-phosphate kinase